MAEIIAKLGGPTEAARKLGLASPNVASNWIKRGVISASMIRAVAKAARMPMRVVAPDLFG